MVTYQIKLEDGRKTFTHSVTASDLTTAAIQGLAYFYSNDPSLTADSVVSVTDSEVPPNTRRHAVGDLLKWLLHDSDGQKFYEANAGLWPLRDELARRLGLYAGKSTFEP